MLVKINSNIYVLASDVISIKKNQRTGSDSYGKWFAYVKTDQNITGFEVPEDEVKILVQDINRFLEK
ncbi:hypothetical protein ACUTA3_06315 [Acinetobacter baumannii]|uniref:hypothetical protein n=1 Tax=Acinetobacter TaxID=469 RepID=UPI000273127C|nr:MULTISPECIES: hypothetical protein [Acinetobacter]AYX96188.1 hypothetical protein EGY13_07345 [Acinetobacter sp. FDAARGOS_493]EHU1227846.1 hypothetical protein [Acinetobacter baumannii]EHU1231595.1 hypothetical protein [Acinetobacter baumannii]EHU1243898.1 hypothetical protein [Acinetobacter baumannii]EHU1249433.1 hypothetical protein [Acinetobacter baumannii]